MQDVYEHLGSFGLESPGEVQDRLAELTDDAVARFWDSYVEMARQRPLAIRASQGALDIYPDSCAGAAALDTVKQLAIYANRIYVHDPLLELADEWANIDWPAPDLLLRLPDREQRAALYRRRLVSIIETMLQMRPLVECEVIHLTPRDLLKRKRKVWTMYADRMFGPNGSMADELHLTDEAPELPRALREYCDEHIAVLPVKLVGREMVRLRSRAATPTDNAIAVGFAEDPVTKYFLLFHASPDGQPGEEGDRRVGLFFPFTERDAVDPRTWEHWVKGCRQEVVMERLSRLETDLLVAAASGARFVTSLDVSRDLAQLSLGSEKEGAGDISALLQLDLPFFDKVAVSDIARARADEEAFEDFRIAMDKAFRAINSLPSSENFQRQVDEISRDLLTRPIKKIERRVEAIKLSMLLETAIGCLSSTIITQGNMLAAAVLASVLGLDLFKKAKAADEELRQLPSFFYWQVTQRGRRSSGGSCD